MAATVVAGVDTHLDTLAISVVDDRGVEVSAVTVTNDNAGFVQGLGFGDRFGVAGWVVEGSGGYGRAWCRFLADHDQPVFEAPTRVTGRYRRRDGWSKTDPGDARAVARAGITQTLPRVSRTTRSEQLRVLVSHREALVAAQTASLCRIRARLVEIDPGYATRLGSINSLQALDRLARFRRRGDHYHQAVAGMIRHEAAMCRRRLVETRRLTRVIADTLGETGQALVDQIPGIGPIGAAKIIATVGDIARFRSDAAFAAYAGAAPLDASSGRQHRHRLNRRGNRQLNRVLDTAIRTQIRLGGEAATYVARRRTEGKTTREAIRAAKRHLARRVWKTLKQTTQLT